ncbi:F-box/kelch-repeat protein SKIP25-like [Impatiens glandulifera]|uniref:F-box/kelch-repeat protein SKIP25-like n=1 Tax=Impatiens glandulifera TaxID=253017 RepID=UPI001FB169A5|nr:F-box/kelch-repeat protein SKIP25-like [Impatiens glandulifera]
MAATNDAPAAPAGVTYYKRQRFPDHHHPLLPGLPDHVAHLCLSRVPPSTLFNVCRSWRQLIYSPSFPSFLSLYTLLLPKNFPDRTQYLDSGCFFSYDPVSCDWQQLPIPPDLCLLHRHPSFLSRDLSVQSISTAAGSLVLLAATAEHFLPALPRPLVFNPISRKWTFGPQLAAPRRWCAAGESGGVIYVASGMGSYYNSRIARSVEKWDRMNGDNWEMLGEMRNGNFCREGTELVSWKGRLWMVNVKGSGPKEGVGYDAVNDDWVEMPAGMICGWKGPAATMDGETLYVLDEEEGVLRKYDDGIWVDVWGEERLKRANQMAAGGGRVCVVCTGGEILVVDVAAAEIRTWVVETPPGYRAMSVHVLPRMTEPEPEIEFG